jgi:hypothetical protein
MTFGSVCSGIEAASMAWEPLGWRCAFVSEIEPAPSAVLAHRFPGVPNLGDFTTIGGDAGPIDVLVGGTPCQSFSVAGKRLGMDDARGNLAIEFLRLAAATPRWLVWENVPGVLSSGGGRDFGAFLGLVGNSGMGGPTESWTLNTSEYPSDAAACSLSDVLETGDVPLRFYLSARACRGILRRAERRERALPPALRTALLRLARFDGRGNGPLGLS